MGYELKVQWVPNNNLRKSGEVRGSYIYVYDTDQEVAKETLKHEFLDYAISQLVQPYRKVTNLLIDFINEAAYKRKEKLVEALCQLVG